MKVFQLAVSEEQLNLIKQALDVLIDKDIDEPGTISSFDDLDEVSLMYDSISDILEEGDTEVTHGLCY